MKRSSRDLGLAEFDSCVNLIFPTVLLTVACFDSNPKVSFEREKNRPLRSLFCVCRLVSLITLPKRFKFRLCTATVGDAHPIETKGK